MDFLIVGGDSEIAAATLLRLRGDGRQAVATTRRGDRLGPDRRFLDLAAPLAGWQPPPGIAAACICAAVARLADCDRDPAGSAVINAVRAVELAELLVARGVYVLFLSTNQVFDGSRPQVPADAPPCPVSEYGRQKARAETGLQALIAAGEPVGILRLAKVAPPGMALLRQWQAALRAGEPVRAFDDMMMAPVPLDDAAAAITALLDARAAGIWQLTGSDDVSYAETALHIARAVGADPSLVQQVPAASAGMPPGATPRHTTLDSRALQQRFAIPRRAPWPVIDAILGEPHSETRHG